MAAATRKATTETEPTTSALIAVFISTDARPSVGYLFQQSTDAST